MKKILLLTLTLSFASLLQGQELTFDNLLSFNQLDQTSISKTLKKLGFTVLYESKSMNHYAYGPMGDKKYLHEIVIQPKSNGNQVVYNAWHAINIINLKKQFYSKQNCFETKEDYYGKIFIEHECSLNGKKVDVSFFYEDKVKSVLIM